jgi:hypothetical protein
MCLILLASSSAEQSSWGGFAELFAFGCLPPMLVSAALCIERPSKARAFGFGLSLFLLAASSHLVLLEGVLCLVALVLIEVLFSGSQALSKLRHAVPWLVIAALPCAVLAPVYLSLLRSMQLGQAANHSEVLTLAEKFDYVFRDGPAFWAAALAVGALLPLVAWLGRRSREAAFLKAGTSFAVASAFMAVALANVRFFYLVPVATATGVALVLAVMPLQRRLTIGTTATCAVLVLLTVNLVLDGQRSFDLYPQQVSFYARLSLSQSILQGIEWLKVNTAPGSLIAVTSGAPQNSPVGWWVQGLAQRPALVQSDPQLLYFESQRLASADADQIFSRFPSASTMPDARSAGVSYLMIIRTWPGYQARAVESFVEANRSLVAFSNEDALIMRVPA